MSRRGSPSWLARQVGHVYTLHLYPAYGNPEGKQQAGHYTGWTHEGRLPERLTDHAMQRGAKLTSLQVASGGSWVVADVEDGVTRDREHQLKYRSATSRCTVCKSVRDYQSGEAAAAEALTRAGWGKANEAQRGLLLKIFAMDAPPPGFETAALPSPKVPAPRLSAGPKPPSPEQLAEMDALADELIARWASPKAESAREAEYEFG